MEVTTKECDNNNNNTVQLVQAADILYDPFGQQRFMSLETVEPLQININTSFLPFRALPITKNNTQKLTLDACGHLKKRKIITTTTTTTTTEEKEETKNNNATTENMDQGSHKRKSDKIDNSLKKGSASKKKLQNIKHYWIPQQNKLNNLNQHLSYKEATQLHADLSDYTPQLNTKAYVVIIDKRINVQYEEAVELKDNFELDQQQQPLDISFNPLFDNSAITMRKQVNLHWNSFVEVNPTAIEEKRNILSHLLTPLDILFFQRCGYMVVRLPSQSDEKTKQDWLKNVSKALFEHVWCRFSDFPIEVDHTFSISAIVTPSLQPLLRLCQFFGFYTVELNPMNEQGIDEVYENALTLKLALQQFFRFSQPNFTQVMQTDTISTVSWQLQKPQPVQPQQTFFQFMSVMPKSTSTGFVFPPPSNIVDLTAATAATTKQKPKTKNNIFNEDYKPTETDQLMFQFRLDSGITKSVLTAGKGVFLYCPQQCTLPPGLYRKTSDQIENPPTEKEVLLESTIEVENVPVTSHAKGSVHTTKTVYFTNDTSSLDTGFLNYFIDVVQRNGWYIENPPSSGDCGILCIARFLEVVKDFKVDEKDSPVFIRKEIASHVVSDIKTGERDDMIEMGFCLNAELAEDLKKVDATYKSIKDTCVQTYLVGDNKSQTNATATSPKINLKLASRWEQKQLVTFDNPANVIKDIKNSNNLDVRTTFPPSSYAEIIACSSIHLMIIDIVSFMNKRKYAVAVYKVNELEPTIYSGDLENTEKIMVLIHTGTHYMLVLPKPLGSGGKIVIPTVDEFKTWSL